jgi:membrane protein DedA with SNARE-associated domain
MDLVPGARWLETYSAIILPVLVVAEQVGIPLPAVPALLLVGALGAQGRVSIPLVLGAIAAVALPVDLIWHELGRRRGARLLTGLCRLSLEPDVCVRRTQGLFQRHGVRAVLVSKFLPGLTTVMPPLAGIFGVSRLRFALYDLAGVFLWAGLWVGVGYVFSETIEAVVQRVSALGRTAGLAVVAASPGPSSTCAAALSPAVDRQPGGSQAKLAAGGRHVLDLRGAGRAGSVCHSGGRWIPAESLAGFRATASCARRLIRSPSAREALRLERRGITRVHPLAGGLAGWTALGFPVEAVAVPTIPALAQPAP